MTGPKVFLDTDLLLDFCQRREPFFNQAAELMQFGLDGRLQLLVSAGALKDIFYFARKAPSNEQTGRTILLDLLQILEVCSLDRGMWEEALRSTLKDTEDALQVACARRHGAIFMATRNLEDYRGTLEPQVLPPEAIVSLLR